MSVAISLFLLGLSFGAGPCLVSCGPLLAPYFVAEGSEPKENLLGYLIFCLGRIAVYAALGVSIFFLGKLAAQTFLESASRYVYIFGGVFVCILGSMFIVGHHPQSRACAFLEKHRAGNMKKNLFFLGLVIGMLPCGPIITLLAYVALISKHWVMSLFYCFIFGLGTIVSPLVLISLFAGRVSAYAKQRKAMWHRIMNCLCGCIMIFLGIQLLYRARG